MWELKAFFLPLRPRIKKKKKNARATIEVLHLFLVATMGVQYSSTFWPTIVWSIVPTIVTEAIPDISPIVMLESHPTIAIFVIYLCYTPMIDGIIHLSILCFASFWSFVSFGVLSFLGFRQTWGFVRFGVSSIFGLRPFFGFRRFFGCRQFFGGFRLFSVFVRFWVWLRQRAPQVVFLKKVTW